MVGGYATRAWGIEIDRVKCDKGNAFMRYAAADMAKRRADWGSFDVPTIRCAPIEEARCSPVLRRRCLNIISAPFCLCLTKLARPSQARPLQGRACTGLGLPCRGWCMPRSGAICRQRAWALDYVRLQPGYACR